MKFHQLIGEKLEQWNLKYFECIYIYIIIGNLILVIKLINSFHSDN